VIFTLPPATSTSTSVTPGSLLTSAVTALAQCSQLIPLTTMYRVSTRMMVARGGGGHGDGNPGG
jgi:hypothetical protein